MTTASSPKTQAPDLRPPAADAARPEDPASALESPTDSPSDPSSEPQFDNGGEGVEDSPVNGAPFAPPTAHKRSLRDKLEDFIGRLSTRNNFWHRVCSMIWLPYAFRSGIQMKRVDATTFTAILPFRRFNRNWYNAMAGAALLGNAEIAGGMYVFGVCGGDYTVVCKNLNYTFLRPCLGPAMYRIKPQEDLNALVATGDEFNVTLDMDVVQQIGIPGKRDKRVGRTVVTFHVTPKSHHKTKKRRKRGDASP